LAIVASSLAGLASALKNFTKTPTNTRANEHTAQEFSWFFGKVGTNHAAIDAAATLADQARNWVAGGGLSPDTSGTWNRVSLPGYVFKKRRYWVEETSAVSKSSRQAAPPVVSVKRSEVSRTRPLVTDFKASEAKAPAPAANGTVPPVKQVSNIKKTQPALAPDEILNRVKQGELEVSKAREMLRGMRSSN